MKIRKPPSTALEAALNKTPKYKHFDLPLGRDDCERLVTDPQAIKSHAFYPFLRLDVVRKRIKKIAPGRIYVARKIREIRYAAHADAAIYAYYNFLLSTKFEARLVDLDLQESILAFRSLGKSNIEFANETFRWIETRTPCVALGFDVEDFFGTLDHGLLKGAWAKLLGVTKLPDDHYQVFRSVTKHSSVELIEARKACGISRSALKTTNRLCEPKQFRDVIRGGGLVQVNHANRGIPQGSPISALLSNIYMEPFDLVMTDVVRKTGGLYRRYCDDILVVVNPKDVTLVKERVEKELNALRLKMQHKKTIECFFNPTSPNPLQYLGLTFDGRTTLLRSSGVAKFYKKMSRGVRQLSRANKMDGRTPLLAQRRKYLLQQYTQNAPNEHRNFPNYVRRAALATGSKAIKRQLRLHLRRFKRLIEQ